MSDDHDDGSHDALSSENNNYNDSIGGGVPKSWNASTIALTILLFVATGLAEIGGGWLVWKAIRGSGGTGSDDDTNKKSPWWYGVLGSLILIVYGILPTLQPVADSFGRLYAVYGGFFIVFSFLWGWALDGDRPDRGDWVGGTIALVGALIVLFWPR